MSADPRAPRDLILEDYVLAVGDAVEVELLVIGQPTQVAPMLVEGTVTDATTTVLVVTHRSSHRLTRIPWGAIATIRNAPAAHPAL